MAESYLNDEKKLLPCAIQLNGEYGVNNVYAGVPVIIGKDGVEKIEQIDLDDKEKKNLCILSMQLKRFGKRHLT